MSGVKLTYHNEGAYEYFTVSNILPAKEYDTVKFEVNMFKKLFQDPQHTGGAVSPDVPLKENSGVFLTRVLAENHRHASSLLVASTNIMNEFMSYTCKNLYNTHSSFGLLAHELTYNTLLSGYKDGDYYRPHRDGGVASLIWWWTDPEKKYEGGNFILPDLGVEISPESYTGVIIPSWYRHEVSPIKSESADFVRYSVSCFMQEPTRNAN